MFILLFILAISGVLYSESAFAQTDSTLKSVQSPPVIVTATRMETDPFTVGRSVDLVDLSAVSSQKSLSSALSQSAGFFVSGDLQMPGALQFSTLRGSAALHQVVLLDGLRISDPTSTDLALDLSELSFAGIGRLEVVRGAHSTLFGSQAIGGVIQLVSETPKPGFSGQVQLQNGRFGRNTFQRTQRISLHGASKNGWFFSTGISGNRTNGFNATVDSAGADAFRLADQSDDFRKLDLQFRGGFTSRKTTAVFTLRSHNQKSDLDDGAFRDDDNHTSRTRRGIGQMHLGHAFSEVFRVDFRASRQRFSRSIEDLPSLIAPGTSDFSLFTSENEGISSTSDLQFTFKTSGFRGVAGFQRQQDEMNIETYFLNEAWAFESRSSLKDVSPQAWLNSVYVHGELDGKLVDKSLEKFSLSGGFRANKHELFGENRTFDLNPVYRVSQKWTAYVNVASGFNAPSLYRLFANDSEFSSGITRGNRNLKAETSLSREAGLKYRWSDAWQFSVAAFNTNVSDLIDYVYLWNSEKPISALDFSDYRGDTYLNVGQQRNRGLEFSFDGKVSETVHLRGNISLLQSTLSVSGAGIDTAKTQQNHVQLYAGGAFLSGENQDVSLTRRPSTMNISADWQASQKWLFQLNWNVLGRRKDAVYNPVLGPYGALGDTELDAISLLSAQANWAISKNVNVQFMGENLLNKQVSDIRGYRGRPRYLGVEAVIQF